MDSQRVDLRLDKGLKFGSWLAGSESVAKRIWGGDLAARERLQHRMSGKGHVNF